MVGIEFLTVNEADVELAVLAVPVRASPPVVLVETFAEPLDDSWLFELMSETWLWFVTVAWFLRTDTTLFVEFGPVLLNEPELAPATPADKPAISPTVVRATPVARIILLFTIGILPFVQ